MKLAIIDYGMGNLKSMYNALSAVAPSELEIFVSSDPAALEKADAYVMPGVGAFADAMKQIKKNEILPVLKTAVLDRKRPLLGVCLGMQLLFEQSVEGGENDGLSMIPGKVVRINSSERIPHIGWSPLSLVTTPDSILEGLVQNDVYFVHSYVVECEHEYVTSTFEYGGKFIASVQKGHIMGTQFHPEKSQHAGLYILRKYIQFSQDWITSC